MNNNTNQKSSKAEKMASGRRENSSRDSNMQSEHYMETSRPSPLRSAALRPEGTEFKVAGHDYGGARQKVQPSSEPILDDKGIPPPSGNVLCHALEMLVQISLATNRKECSQPEERKSETGY